MSETITEVFEFFIQFEYNRLIYNEKDTDDIVELKKKKKDTDDSGSSSHDFCHIISFIFS